MSEQSERWAEANRRNQMARRRAMKVLAARHPEEWEALLVDARREVAEEKGPLP